MKTVLERGVAQFVGFQRQLVGAFKEVYPNAKDFKWLLDFPKKGVVRLDNDKWSFVKHGVGLRFVRLGNEMSLVVDVYKKINEPSIVDWWRLTQFFESCNVDVTKAQLLVLLSNMCSENYLLDLGEGLYLFSGPAED